MHQRFRPLSPGRCARPQLRSFLDAFGVPQGLFETATAKLPLQRQGDGLRAVLEALLRAAGAV